jgi:hypothetical protein
LIDTHYRVKENYPVALAAASPNRGTRKSPRAPAGRRTDTAKPRRNNHWGNQLDIPNQDELWAVLVARHFERLLTEHRT